MKPLLPAIVLSLLLSACAREGGEAAPGTDATGAQAAVADAGAADAETDAAPDKPAIPSLKLSTVHGEDYDLAEHRGRWVVVNFWATWCSPCLKEMPELSALAASREHIDAIGLAYEEIETAAMLAFLEEHPVDYPVAILDVYDPPADFDTPRGLPMTYLIAPDGRVARQFLGPVTGGEIERVIAAWVEAGAVEAGGPDPAAG